MVLYSIARIVPSMNLVYGTAMTGTGRSTNLSTPKKLLIEPPFVIIIPIPFAVSIELPPPIPIMTSHSVWTAY